MMGYKLTQASRNTKMQICQDSKPGKLMQMSLTKWTRSLQSIPRKSIQYQTQYSLLVGGQNTEGDDSRRNPPGNHRKLAGMDFLDQQ
jgi:hypothetical protein